MRLRGKLPNGIRASSLAQSHSLKRPVLSLLCHKTHELPVHGSPSNGAHAEKCWPTTNPHHGSKRSRREPVGHACVPTLLGKFFPTT